MSNYHAILSGIEIGADEKELEPTLNNCTASERREFRKCCKEHPRPIQKKPSHTHPHPIEIKW